MSEAQGKSAFDLLSEGLEYAEQAFAHFNQREADLWDGKLCAMCNKRFTSEELDDPSAVHVHVESWVSGPKLDHPVLRRQTGKRAHTTCINKVIDGEAPDQEPIPGLGE